ncbi:hypothetical protein [Mycobacterium kubicae]|uniref:hypothetical protein n=1 Tax=Mycobacterium kubicae TaxID=120959 RepID=UPI001F11C466|nr:hypothetical protein [Mycobacterium kubicae]
MSPRVTTALVDDDRSVCLCDAGASDYAAVTAVRPDGTVLLLLAEKDGIGDPAAVFDAGCADAPHEQPGPLPALWQTRVELAPLRCGRRTLRGGRCRMPVGQPGQACGWHRRAPDDTDRQETTP